MKRLKLLPWTELALWSGGLIFLAFQNPSSEGFTLCPIKSFSGWDCPGCGLGHSISWLFRGELATSWETHKMGMPALGILVFRIGQLINLALKPRHHYHEPEQSNSSKHPRN